MTIALAIIQARTSSARLPGKVMRALCGTPMIEHVISRVRLAQSFDQIIVVTSDEPSDDNLAEYCTGLNVEVLRGSLLNVASRFKLAIEKYRPTYFARICGDSPLYDPELLDLALRELTKGDWDLVTNTLKRTFPKGLSVEVMKAAVFLEAVDQITDPQDLEHVTRYFYNNKSRFKIKNIESELGDFSHISLSVDTLDDFNRIEKLLLDKRKKLSKLNWEEMIQGQI